MQFREAVIALTYRCNSRCVMCNIWKAEEIPEVDRRFFNNLPTSLKSVSLSGGEPFLRHDLVEIVGIVRKRCRMARIVIVTNGLAPEIIRKRIADLLTIDRKLTIRVSLDGPEKIHDSIRGVGGAYSKVMETLDVFREAGLGNLGLNFTIVDENVEYINEMYDFARKEGLWINYQVAHNSAIYYKSKNKLIKKTSELRDQLNVLIKKELCSLNPVNWFKAFYYSGLYGYALRKERILSCYAGGLFFFMSPSGVIYPCLFLDEKMGSIREFDKIAPKIIKGCDINCWQTCTTSPLIKLRPYVALPWIIKAQLKNMLGAKEFLE